jgi:hypothetical protein
MKDLLFAYIELNSVLDYTHTDKYVEVRELIIQFNQDMSTNFDPDNTTLEYLSYDHSFRS